MRKSIEWTEKNRYGAWTIYGCIGLRQYYGMGKREALRRYKNEVLEKRICFGSAVIYQEN